MAIKPKFTDDFDSNVRILARRKSLDSMDAVYERATCETLNAIVEKQKDNREFWRLRAYGECLTAVCFVEAAKWNDEIAATIPDAMRPHLKKVADFQRRQELELRHPSRRRSKSKRVAKAA